MTEDQQGGTGSEPEAGASGASQPSDQPVGAVAVAEPATADPNEAEAVAGTAAAAPTAPDTARDETNGAGAGTQRPDADEMAEALSVPAADGAMDVGPADAAPAAAAVTPDETADAPAAAEEDDVPAPRVLGPEPTTMAELLAEQDSEIKSFKHGDVVEGSVVRIDKDEILVDIGAKSEGVVSNRELYGRNAETQPALNIGDTVLVYVLQPESPEGHVVLSLRRAGLERKWRSMQEQFETGVIIEAPVIDHNKGGLIVDCGIRGFVPISQIVDFPRRPQNDQPRDAAQEIAEKLQPFVGRKLRLKILEVNRKANRLILSEKVALYEERREKRDELFSSLQVGQRVTGTIRSIAPFGVFIDLGGIDGLVHKSELSWNKVNNPESGYKVGEEVEAEVIDINHERGRISLSIRRLQPDPWHSTVADFNTGDVIDGTVTKLVNFGAFVRVRDGLEGLIHISELSHQRVAHPGDVVHEGQQLKLKIISLDSERHRLGLSLKQAEEPPARPAADAQPGAGQSGQAANFQYPSPAQPRPERRPRPDRAWSNSDAVQEPEGGIDNTLASAFAQVRQQVAASEEARARGSEADVDDGAPAAADASPDAGGADDAPDATASAAAVTDGVPDTESTAGTADVAEPEAETDAGTATPPAPSEASAATEDVPDPDAAAGAPDTAEPETPQAAADASLSAGSPEAGSPTAASPDAASPDAPSPDAGATVFDGDVTAADAPDIEAAAGTRDTAEPESGAGSEGTEEEGTPAGA